MGGLRGRAGVEVERVVFPGQFLKLFLWKSFAVCRPSRRECRSGDTLVE